MNWVRLNTLFTERYSDIIINKTDVVVGGISLVTGYSSSIKGKSPINGATVSIRVNPNNGSNAYLRS